MSRLHPPWLHSSADWLVTSPYPTVRQSKLVDDDRSAERETERKFTSILSFDVTEESYKLHQKLAFTAFKTYMILI
jgi:hypothetical protein